METGLGHWTFFFLALPLAPVSSAGPGRGRSLVLQHLGAGGVLCISSAFGASHRAGIGESLRGKGLESVAQDNTKNE